jgi:response regulator RpfG family c-di-GMP phosphodiesterase
MDGHVFLEELSKVDDFFSIPFIFILPNSSENITLNSKERGVVDYISKPFKNSELVTKIESLIHKEYDI